MRILGNIVHNGDGILGQTCIDLFLISYRKGQRFYRPPAHHWQYGPLFTNTKVTLKNRAHPIST